MMLCEFVWTFLIVYLGYLNRPAMAATVPRILEYIEGAIVMSDV